jgi:serine/threonine-protein kinase RsbW
VVSGPPPPGTDDLVTLTVPAASGYVSLLRSVAAGVAARVDLDLDRIEDVRLAVSEACAVVLADAPVGAVLTLTLRPGPEALRVEVSAPGHRVPDPDSFAWTVLSALADHAAGRQHDGSVHVLLQFGAVEAEVAGAEPA